MAQEVTPTLHLRCGDLVEVRSADEILATLDADGKLEGMPFMPEMLRFCGQRLRVERSAHKSCDTITGSHGGLRLERAVHLERSRCDGAAHGGCQAACLLFWKEAWLKRVEPERPGAVWRAVSALGASTPATPAPDRAPRLEDLPRLAIREAATGPEGPAYRCQATELLGASRRQAWWEPLQYLRDWLSGNVPLRTLVGGILLRMLYHVVVHGPGKRAKRHVYDAVARVFGFAPWPFDVGPLTGKTPSRRTDLQPGERVQIKPHAEILETLNGRVNRGIGFAPEMASYCGGTYRVRARVDQILDEKTGRMMRMKNDCIVLEDVVCSSDCSSDRLFCPRRIYSYWREIWLERVP